MLTQRTNTICLLVSLDCFSVVANPSSAKLVARRDPRDANLDTELVVTVHQQAPSEAQAMLAEFAGQDLEDSPESWLSWYRAKYETSSPRP